MSAKGRSEKGPKQDGHTLNVQLRTEKGPERDGLIVSDPSRVLALLWGDVPEGTRGPKRRVSLDQIVRAGLELAREGGLEQLSMRAVAKKLGVGAMTLYTHVPGKAELVELMIDATFADRVPLDPDATWQDRIRAHANEVRRSYERDPWLLQTNLWRRPLGPHTVGAEERLLQTLLDAGLEPTDVVVNSDLIEAFVLGRTGGRIADEEETKRTGVSADQYWQQRSEFWETYFSWEDHPAMVRLWEAGAFDQDVPHAFDRQLERIISGIERQVAG